VYEQPGAVQVQADALRARARGDAHQLRAVEQLPAQAANRRLDRDDADVRPHAAGRGAVEDLLDVVPGERRPSGCEGDEVQARQRLRRVARVVVDVAHVLDDHASPSAREGAQRDVVRERAGREEERALLAEERREVLLQLLGRAAQAVLVGGEAGGTQAIREERHRLGRRELGAVARHADLGRPLRRRPRPSARERRQECARPHETATRDLSHGDPPPSPKRSGAGPLGVAHDDLGGGHVLDLHAGRVERRDLVAGAPRGRSARPRF
jgi:hypothetical protein